MTSNAEGLDIRVVGGGVIGLTSAVALAEDGHRVRVLSRDAAGGTTSAVAGGLCWPYRIQPYERAVAWSVRSFQVLTALAERPHGDGRPDGDGHDDGHDGRRR